MRRNKILSSWVIVMLMIFLSSATMQASEKYACIAENFDSIPQSRSGIQQQASSDIQPDRYEPNNNTDQAYPYAMTKKLTGWEFNRGYVSSNCHVEGDEDFFRMTLTKGVTYDVILKNLYRHDRHIYIWMRNVDGSWTRWKYKYQEAGQPEHYKFIPDKTGEYYIQIAGGGVTGVSFWFAVEKEGTVNTALWPSELE